MTNGSKRAVLLARKSTKQDKTEEQSASVTDQLDRNRAYAARQGWQVVGEFSDDGRSGLLDRTKRPGLDDTLKMIEAGDADVLVTLWTSRLSRDERDRAEILDMFDLLSVEWYAVEDGGRIDRSTYAGYITYGVHTIFDVAYSKRVGENWRRAHEKRLEAGLPKTTSPRFGYRYEAKTEKNGASYVIHNDEAEAVCNLYRRYTRGDGFTQLVTWLNRDGWRVPATDGEWTVRTLSRFMDSGFSAGFISREADLRDLRGAHETIVTESEWLAYRGQREKRALLGRKASGASERWWLAGLVRCGACGGSVYVDSFARHSSLVCCSNRRGNPDSCSGMSILRSYVERAIGLWLIPHLDRLDALTNSESMSTANAAASTYSDAVAQRDKVRDALADLEVRKSLGEIEASVFRAAQTKLTARLQAAETAAQEATALMEGPQPDTESLRAAEANGWTADERAALRGVLDRVEVGKDALTIVPVTGEPTTRTRAELAPRCGVSGCGRVAYTRGLCKSHVMRSRKVGDDVFEALAQRVGDAEEAPERTPTMDEVEAVLTAAHDVAV